MGRYFYLLFSLALLNISLNIAVSLNVISYEISKDDCMKHSKNEGFNAGELFFSFFDIQEDIEPDKIDGIYISQTKKPFYICYLNQKMQAISKLGLILFEADVSPPLYI